MLKILLSGNAKLQYYVDAVNAVGGDAVAKYLPDICTDYDGLILCGGNDFDPKYYRQEMNGSVNIDHRRDEVEFALLKAFVDAKKPVLGICRGHQMINVYFGGSLYQDIPEKDLHITKQDFDIAHDVTAIENSVIHNMHGSSFTVNSSHHQVIDTLGKDLIATAYWNDQYIEAIEHKFLPIYGVQWHPERMCVSKARPDTVDGTEVFKWFIKVCEENKI